MTPAKTDPFTGLDGEQYVILATETENNDEPQMSRYTVKRVSDGAIINNFPAYLLRGKK